MQPITKTALELLSPSETALVLFTRGGRLHLDPEGQSGSTGNWTLGSSRRFDRVIIYKREKKAEGGGGSIYVATYTGATPSEEPGKSVVHFNEYHSLGRTHLTWPDFAVTGTNPKRFLAADDPSSDDEPCDGVPAHVGNAELTLGSIPSSDADWNSIQHFALTFHGYEVCGSFDACAEIANAQRRKTLTDLRISLFFEQRRWRFQGDDPTEDAMRYTRDLIEVIRQKVQRHDLE